MYSQPWTASSLNGWLVQEQARTTRIYKTTALVIDVTRRAIEDEETNDTLTTLLPEPRSLALRAGQGISVSEWRGCMFKTEDICIAAT